MKPAPIERVARRPTLLAVAIVVLVCAAAASGAPYDLLADGSDEWLWTAQVVLNTDKNLTGRRTIVRVRGAGESERWRQVAELAAPAIALTHRGDELVVLLQGGDWRFVSESSVRSGDRLPGNQPVLAISGDGQTLWAIGLAAPPGTTTTTTTTSAPTTGAAATRPALPAPIAAATTTTQVERSTTAPLATTGSVPLMLYRLDRGEWVAVAPLPAAILRPGNVELVGLAMTVIDGRPLLGGLGADGSLRTAQLADDHAWRDRGALQMPADLVRFDLLRYRGRATLWAAQEKGAGMLYELADGRWAGPVELRPQSELGPGTDRALTVAFGRLRLLYAGGDRKLFEQSFGPEGAADAPPTQGQVQPPPPDPRIAQMVQLGVMVLLTFVMLSALRRRGSIQEAMRKAKTLSLAPIGSRFLAGVIDALPLLAVPIVVAIDAPTMEAWKLRMNDQVVQAWEGAALLFYLAYTTTSELLFARTLGKLLLGLRVASLNGSRPSAKAIVIRNGLRLIDVLLALFPLTMILLSPLRQRIGDIAAGTLVIRSGVVSPPPSEPDEPPDDG